METNTQAWTIEPASNGDNGAPLWYYILDPENKIVASTWSGSENQLEHARLIAAVPEMLEALKLSAEIFRVYEQIHSVKGSQDKAERNRNYAECIEAIIAKAEGGAQ